nr:monocarboxylate transporter 2-like [Lytechinus pictus]
MASLNIDDDKLDHDLNEDDPAGADENAMKEETNLIDKEIREGGWGWVIVFWAFFTKLLFSGTIKAFGVLMPNLVIHFGGTSISKLGLILALFGTFSDITGFTSAPLCKVFGARSVAVVGGILCSSGVILASFVTSSTQLAVCLAVAGFGFGFPLVPSLELIRLFFTKRFAIANGLIYSGTGIGVVVFAPLGQVLLDTYGWRGTFMVLGALCLHVVVHGAVLRPLPNKHGNEDGAKPKKTEKVALSEQKDRDIIHLKNLTKNKTCNLHEDRIPLLSTSTHDLNLNGSPLSLSPLQRTSAEDDDEAIRSRCWNTCGHHFPFKLFRNPLLYLVLILQFFARFAIVGWLLFFIPYLQSKGMTPLVAASIASVSGIFSTIARATHGLIIDFGFLTSEKLYLMATWALALSLMLCPVLDSHAQNMAAAALNGVGNGIVMPLGTVLLKQSTDRDVFRSSLSLSYGINSLARLLGGYTIGKYA